MGPHHARKGLLLTLLLALAALAQEKDRPALREFYGAPPANPHEVEDEQSSEDCLACHAELIDFGDRVAPGMPHALLSNCQQCHVRTTRPAWMQGRELPADWTGLEEPSGSEPDHDYAPPPVPHKLRMREKCNACHHPDNPDPALTNPHPQRSNCLQCHVAGGEE